MRAWAWLLLMGLAGCQCQRPAPEPDAGALPEVDAGAGPGVLQFGIADFGAVLRGDERELPVHFSTTADQDLVLTALRTSGPFALVGPDSVTVPAGGEVDVPLRFAPTSLGLLSGGLTFEHAGRTSTLPLQGSGFGPVLELTPAQVDLGIVPLYDGAVATAEGPLLLRNVGLDAVPSRPEAALQVFFEVVPTDGTAPDELCLGDCSVTTLRLEVDGGAEVPLRLASTTPGHKSWDVRVFSNDPSEPVKTVAVVAEVVARPTCQFSLPAQLAFGVVTAPDRRELELVFENVGTEVCEVTAVDVGAETPTQSSPLFSLVNPPAGTQRVGPGGLLRLVVRAWPHGPVPTQPTSVRADLQLGLNVAGGAARVALSADLGLSCLAVTPTPVDFGTVQAGCRSQDRAVTLRNGCSTPVTVTSASLAAFSSFSVTASLPQTLAANTALELTVRHTPASVGVDRAALSLAWLEGMSSRLTVVPLRGEANTTGVNTDTFTPRSNKLDLLIALDDSCSMMDKQTQVSSLLPELLLALRANGVDYQLGVVTAGDGENGVLRRTSTGSRWLTPVTANATALSELTQWTGHFDLEDCEGPFLRAVTAPNIVSPQLNGGFLREDAALDLLCLSDVTQFAFRLDQLRGVKAPDGDVTWDAIAPQNVGTPQCAGAWLPPVPGGLMPSEATGGSEIDICASSWAPLFQTIAQRAGSLRSWYRLRARPDLNAAPITVTVGGQNVGPSTNGATVWSWQSPQNAVVFSPFYAPLASDLVSISYQVACAP